MEKIDLKELVEAFRNRCDDCVMVISKDCGDARKKCAYAKAADAIEELQEKAEHYKQAYQDEVDSKAEAIRKLRETYESAEMIGSLVDDLEEALDTIAGFKKLRTISQQLENFACNTNLTGKQVTFILQVAEDINELLGGTE